MMKQVKDENTAFNIIKFKFSIKLNIKIVYERSMMVYL